MTLLFFSIIWSILLCYFLIAPFVYSPLIIIVFFFSIIGFLLLKKRSKTTKKIVYPLAAAAFIAAFTITSYAVFEPVNTAIDVTTPVDSDKRAVIFYCQGEMEKYTPFYSKGVLKDTPHILKPIEAFQLKLLYKRLGGSSKNYSLIRVASQVKNSLLSNGPYYYYIAFSDYTPDIKTSLSQAIKDGCGDITIINYTCCYDLESTLSSALSLKQLEARGINVSVTMPVCSSPPFQQVFLTKILSMPEKYDGILLISEYSPFSSSTQALIMENGYDSSRVIITESVKDGLQYFTDLGCSCVLYVNLNQSGDGIVSQAIIPDKISKFNPPFSITGIKEWGYDINFVRASIDVYNACQAQQ